MRLSSPVFALILAHRAAAQVPSNFATWRVGPPLGASRRPAATTAIATVASSTLPGIPQTSSSIDGGGDGGLGGVCSWGYTYCGYILSNNNGFSNETIEAAFCAVEGNCPDGTAASASTSYLGALYVCLPADPQITKMKRQATPDEPAPTAIGSPDCPPHLGPHKLQLLCSCGGDPDPQKACLNPESDHIGRCLNPCHN
ncbi:uncharacterized protein E0L32_008172 [Thyridium curvatum]|uniref:Uncharacterized protein n=1 Tax=Thyridium curvatum TaxID=1093900 RepID=A0A507AW52_9PEZI|nr:uncharacterized protein E0L32_008172 [Thyridium curvatum]TPX10966.1 hypothetical protein E0L32_008172 [Thyridium curvatum]